MASSRSGSDDGSPRLQHGASLAVLRNNREGIETLHNSHQYQQFDDGRLSSANLKGCGIQACCKFSKRWVLPEEMRDELAEVVGEIIPDELILEKLADSGVIITIGDVVTLSLLEKGIRPDLSIVDYQTKRMPDDELKERLAAFPEKEITVKCPAGEISQEMWNAIESWLDQPTPLRIVVDGEEDLAALVCVALAPDGTTVIYGIPFKGLMLLHVATPIRERAREILKKMET